MGVTVAGHAGFCFGVERAVNKVYDLLKTGRKVYTYGPIIHNEAVVSDLRDRGVTIIREDSEIEGVREGVIVVRSHGVPEEVFLRMKKREEETDGRVTVVDATCPFVKKIHKIVRKASEEGRKVVICGDADHPEVAGIMGWCLGPAFPVKSPEEAELLPLVPGEPVTVVSQTTFNLSNFKKILEKLEEKFYTRSDSVVNTICNATEERQAEARELAAASDAMIIIGGQTSSNTRKLYEISRELCADTFYVQSAADLDKDAFLAFHSIGITAGASTPRNIIEEVQKIMEENFEQMLEESMKSIHNGEVVEGTVISVKEDEIVLNIGYKADGIIPRNEYPCQAAQDLRDVVTEGQTLSAKVLKVNDGEGQVLLSCRRVMGDRVSEILTEAYENKTVLTAKVASVEEKGLIVVVDETRIFIPASMVSDVFEKDLSKYQDQEISFVLVEYDVKSRKKRIIGDRKQLLVAEKKAKAAETLASLEPGDVIEDGIVKNVTDFGVFVDIGGIDGLLHVSEMGWGRVENPKKKFKAGDKITVFVKDIKGEKIALSKKFDDENPWADAENRFAIGTIVTGKVARMTSFGAFVELVPGVDALLHVSQISWDRVEKPQDVLTVGQEIEAKIVDFKPEEKKISLSMKVLTENPYKNGAPAAAESEETASEE